MLTPILSALMVSLLLFWRFGYIKKMVERTANRIVKEAIVPIERALARHTIQIEGLHAQAQDNRHKIIQLVWSGANSVASAAIWAKQPPRPREVEVAIGDYRRILGDDDLDSNVT